MSDRIKNWWRIYGDLAAHIPKPVWDELDAAIRADERDKIAAALLSRRTPTTETPE